jgi:dolichyl-phosphate beta-glucosyltransferase
MLDSITYLLPLHNKATVIETTIENILEKFSELNLQIVVVENGSTDNSLNTVKKISEKVKEVVVLQSKKGFGNAVSCGLEYITKHRPEDLVIITGADLPFGFTDFDYYLKNYQYLDCELLIGSKKHENSVIQRETSRNFVSRIYNYILKLLFNLKIKDTQGSLIINSKKCNLDILKPKSASFFSSAEICINALKIGYSIIEIPITLIQHENNKSTVNLKGDIKDALVDIIKLKFG